MSRLLPVERTITTNIFPQESGNNPHQNPNRKQACLDAAVNMAVSKFRQPTSSLGVTLSPSIGCYTKGLPCDEHGIATEESYQNLLTAVQSGNPEDFRKIKLGGQRKLVNPQSAFGFDPLGIDASVLKIPACPSWTSDQAMGELIENYWLALTADIPFSEYSSSPLIAEAVTDLQARRAFVNQTFGTGSLTLSNGVPPPGP